MDSAFHLVVILLIVALFATIIYEIYVIFVTIAGGDITHTIDGILFAFILVELFTILYTYLVKHYIKVERVIEVGIISIVREIIFKHLEMGTDMVYATATLLIALGVLFLIEKHYSKERNV